MTLSKKSSGGLLLPICKSSVMDLAPCRLGAALCGPDCGRSEHGRSGKKRRESEKVDFGGDDHNDPEAAWETMIMDRSRTTARPSHAVAVPAWSQQTSSVTVGGVQFASPTQYHQHARQNHLTPRGEKGPNSPHDDSSEAFVIQIDNENPGIPSPRGEGQQMFGGQTDQSAHLVQRRNTHHNSTALSPEYRGRDSSMGAGFNGAAYRVNSPGVQGYGGRQAISAPSSPRDHRRLGDLMSPSVETREVDVEAGAFAGIEEEIDLEAQPAMVHMEEIRRLKEQLQLTQQQLERTNEDAKRIVHQSWRHIDSLEGKLRESGAKSLPSYFVEVPFNEIRFGSVIGEGAFGRVHRGLWKGTDVAIKQLSCQHLSEQMLVDVKNEIQLLSSLRHPNVVLFMGACTTPPNICILTEYCSRGSLYQLIHSPDRDLLDLRLIKKIATQVARALHHLHTMTPAVVHRDVKSANILLDESFNARVTDFGLARLKAHTQTMTGQVGTIHWMAPEVLASDQYHEKADVYGFGITLAEMVSKSLPYEGMTNMQIGMAVLQKGLRPYLPPTCDPTLAGLIQACWHTQQEKRPSFDRVLEWLDKVPA